jgi:hypothetical protein
MGTYGAEFVSVGAPPERMTDGIQTGPNGGTITAGWLARVNGLGSVLLYFPAGRWTINASPLAGVTLPAKWTPQAFRDATNMSVASAPAREARDARLHELQSLTNDNPWNADIILSPTVELVFAPGARIELVENVRMVVQGSIDAPDQQIVHEVGNAMLIPAWRNQAPLKAVWWGAGLGNLQGDARALERAMEAATERRRPWRARFPVSAQLSAEPAVLLTQAEFRETPVVDNNKVLPSLPLILQGTISLERTVRVGERDPFGLNAFYFRRPPQSRLVVPLRNSVILQGMANGRSRPSARMTAHSTFVDDRAGGGSALLSLSFTRASVVKNIAFDGGRRASRCLELTSQFPDREMHQILVQQCSFTGALQTQLQAGPPREETSDLSALPDALSIQGPLNTRIRLIAPVTTPGRTYPASYPVDPNINHAEVVAAFPSADLSGLLITACNFDVQRDDRSASAPAPTAIQIRASQALPATVSFCHFRGEADAFIAANACTVLVEGCSFDNKLTPPWRKPIATGNADPVNRDNLPGFERSLGADLEIPLDPVDAARASSFVSGDAPLAGVFLFGCSSTSSMLLSTHRPTPFLSQRSIRAVVILGCVQWNNPSRTANDGSIRWGIPLGTPGPRTPVRNPGPDYVQRLGSDMGLCIVGSSFNAPVGVYLGATPVCLAGVVNTTSRTRFRFLPVVEGIARKTIILGYAALTLLALLGGCRSEAPTAKPDAGMVSTADLGAGGDLGRAADVPPTVNRDVVTRPRPDIVFPDDVVAEDVQLLDAPSNRDAGNPLTGDVIQYASLGPARQQRHRCPEITDGDPTIAAPRLIYPLSGTRATSRRPGFRWELAAGTTGARVEVCADPCCARVITAYDATGATQRPAEMLPPGVVWWRARGRTAAGYGRATSFTWEVGIKRRDAPVDSAWGSIRDVDGDGYDDFVAGANYNARSRHYYVRGGPSGLRFDPGNHWSYPQGTTYSFMLGGDFNADGRADLIFSDERLPTGAPAILGGWDESTGRFSPRATFEYVSHLGSAVDINGDGFQDLILDQETRRSGSLRALHTYVVYGGPSLGDGGVSEIPESVLGPGTSFAQTRTAAYSVGDLNGDGYGDVLFADSFEHRVFILRGGRGGPESTPALQLDSPTQSDGSGFGLEPGLAADINGDQLIDFAFTLLNRRAVRLYLGDRERIAVFHSDIQDPTPPEEGHRSSRGFGRNMGPSVDSNGDGQAELLVDCLDCLAPDEPSGRLPYGVLCVYERRESSGVELTATLQGTSLDSVGYSGFGVGDLNGDGFDDVVSASSAISGRLLVLWGGTTGISMRSRTFLEVPPNVPNSGTEPAFGSELASRPLHAQRRM